MVSLSKRTWQSVRKIARDKLDFESLRPGQKQALEAVLQGQDTLAVLPTGSGKSAIYQDQGVVERSTTGEASLSRFGEDIADQIARAVGAQEQLRQRQRERVEALRSYARARTCRRALLLEHFGDHLAGECTGCDNCDERHALAAEPAEPPQQASEPTPSESRANGVLPFPLRSRVLHKTWGKGSVVGYQGAHNERVIVDFDLAGERPIELESHGAEPVLEPAS